MTDLLQGFLSGSAAWGVLLTLAAFALGALLNKATGKAIFNPLLLGSIFVIILLSVLNIPYADYKASAAPVNYLLLPATISLAIPLYEKWDLLEGECRRHHRGHLRGYSGEPGQRFGSDPRAGPHSGAVRHPPAEVRHHGHQHGCRR